MLRTRSATRCLGRHFDRTLPEPLAGDALDEVALQYAIAFAGVLVLAAAMGWVVAGRARALFERITANCG